MRTPQQEQDSYFRSLQTGISDGSWSGHAGSEQFKYNEQQRKESNAALSRSSSPSHPARPSETIFGLLVIAAIIAAIFYGSNMVSAINNGLPAGESAVGLVASLGAVALMRRFRAAIIKTVSALLWLGLIVVILYFLGVGR